MRKLLLPLLALTALFVACSDDDKPNYAPIAVDVHELVAPLAGEQLLVSISCAGDWTITPSDSWLRAEVQKGTGDAQVTLTVAANGEDEIRSGEYLFESGDNSDVLKITQLGSETDLKDYVSESFYNYLKDFLFQETVTAGDVAVLEHIFFSFMNLAYDLDGIHFLTSLKNFDGAPFPIEKADFSRNTALESIFLGMARDLESLNVRGCAKLTELNVEMAVKLKELDLTDNTKLVKLNVYGGGFESLDLSMCPDIDYIDAEECENLKEIIMPANLKDLTTMELFAVPVGTEVKWATAAE